MQNNVLSAENKRCRLKQMEQVIINFFIIQTRVFYWKIHHSENSYETTSGTPLVKISMISLISSLSLKLYLNLLVYDRNIFGSSQKSSAIFGNLQKFQENVRQCPCDLRTSFIEFSEVFGKWSEIIKNTVISKKIFYIIKRTLHVSLKI